MSKKVLVLILLLVARVGSAAEGFASGAAATQCAHPWLFFDLGLNTLLDTSHEDPTTHEMVDVQWMPGAYEYLNQLRDAGYRLGLLVDVPENWGGDDKTALATTQRYIADAWIHGDPKGMDWTLFESNAMFFPPKNKYRKAANSLYLFQKALALAAADGCPALHQATKPKEVYLAKKAGMKTYRVGQPGQPYYLPIAQIEEMLK